MAENDTTGDVEFDMEAAVDTIGAGLGLGADDADTEVVLDDAPGGGEPKDAPVKETVEPITRAAPKSWAKEKHEIWARLPPEAQEVFEQREKQMLDGLEGYKTDAGFGKSLREAVAPFQGMLDQHKIDVPKAVSYLLGAHQRLSYGTPESRRAAYEELGRSMGFTAADPNAPAADPKYQALEQKLNTLETTLTERQQRENSAAMEKINAEIDAFAADATHPYYNEVEDDLLPFLRAGKSLPEAYEKAVWANPVTRAKEQARLQTEAEKKFKENARLDALKGRKASGTNVRTRDTNKAPTEPLGTMEDTMKETLAEIRARTH